MKKILLLSVVLIVSQSIFAQRNGYVDYEYVLSKIPSYQVVKAKLDGISKKMHKEVDAKFKEFDLKNKEYQDEKVLLSEEMKKKKIEELRRLENEARNLARKYFAKGGDLDKKRRELEKPIHEEILRAISEVGQEGNYADIENSSYADIYLYVNPKYDVSDDVLKKISF